MIIFVLLLPFFLAALLSVVATFVAAGLAIYSIFKRGERARTVVAALLAIGKVQKNDGRYLLPFYVSFHHALADGLHVARLVKHIEEEACELISNYT